MLTALGLWEDGHWESLTWQLAPNEEAASWSAFVGTLYTKRSYTTISDVVLADLCPLSIMRGLCSTTQHRKRGRYTIRDH